MVNPVFNSYRFKFERTPGEEDIFPQGPWLVAGANMGNRHVEVVFAKTERNEALIKRLWDAPKEEIDELWLKQIIYSYGIGVLRIACERSTGNGKDLSEYERTMRSMFNVLLVFDFNNVEGQISKINTQMSNSYNQIGAAGEVDLKGSIPESKFKYILVPRHLVNIVRNAGFEGKIIEAPIIETATGEIVPDYENVLRKLIERDKAPLLAHIVRLPTPTETIDDELKMIQENDSKDSRQALFQIMTRGGLNEVVEAAVGLAKIGDNSAIEPLATALMNINRVYMPLISEALATMTSPRAKEVLWHILENTDLEEECCRYYYIASALVKSGDIKAISCLERLILQGKISFDIDIPEAIEIIVKGLETENGKFSERP